MKGARLRAAWRALERLDQRIDRLPGTGGVLTLLAGGLGLGVFAYWRMRAGLAPDSFWYDDLWPTVLARQTSLSGFFSLLPPLPLGFFGLLRVSESVFGEGHLALQLPAPANVYLHSARSG
jgi:hypothetical protein